MKKRALPFTPKELRPPSCLRVRLFGPFETPWLEDKDPGPSCPFPFVRASLLGQSLLTLLLRTVTQVPSNLPRCPPIANCKILCRALEIDHSVFVTVHLASGKKRKRTKQELYGASHSSTSEYSTPKTPFADVCNPATNVACENGRVIAGIF